MEHWYRVQPQWIHLWTHCVIIETLWTIRYTITYCKSRSRKEDTLHKTAFSFWLCFPMMQIVKCRRKLWRILHEGLSDFLPGEVFKKVSLSVKYGSGNGPFKIHTIITYLSCNLFENKFNQNYDTWICWNYIA